MEGSAIGIYQPVFKAALAERLDPGFIALSWLSNPMPALRELALHRHIAINKIYERHRLTGLFSAKFFSKTRLRSQQVHQWISENPGYDVYLINGMPYIPYASYNLIERSTNIHNPRFEKWARFVSSVIGLELPEPLPRQTNANLCACNYWVGSARFWESLSRDVLTPLFHLVDNRKQADEIFGYHRYSAPTPVYNLTIVYERLMDHYVAQSQLKALYFPWSGARALGLDCYLPSIKTYLETMIPLVDRIDEKGVWSKRDRDWLQRQYAAVNVGDSAEEVLARDPIDFDLPRVYPTA